ncbi:hypothetical protein L1049_018359 [Liquidambar formosana]|uniref:Uncharacterized protein n=1 Tax=Liquidambar formosana TaxID=63359 RepID=A0AAP0WM49_LIQFO
MGLSLSLPLSAWNEILSHKFYRLSDAVETVIVSSITFGKKYGEKALRTISFKKDDSETNNKSEGSEEVILERSMSFKNWESEEAKLEKSVSLNDMVPDKENLDSISLKGNLMNQSR